MLSIPWWRWSQISILSRFYFYQSWAWCRASSHPYFNPIKVLFLLWIHNDAETIMKWISILSRFYFYSYFYRPQWKQMTRFQSYQGSIFTAFVLDYHAVPTWNFNPIKVLFLPGGIRIEALGNGNFNPIKVLFLPVNWKQDCSKDRKFQSYQGSIFTQISITERERSIGISILSRFYFYKWSRSVCYKYRSDFNPIKVLFLLWGDWYPKIDASNFNPIKVLFLLYTLSTIVFSRN